ncbi:MAG: NAD(P)/FAD-dependent oxidoreductase [Eubacteriales bacterium]
MYDVIVVGAGPAGMTAALYALRAGKKVLLIEKENIGGQITFSPHVENYPALKSVSGLEFSDALYEQINEHGAEFEFDAVTKIVCGQDTKKVYCGEKIHEARAVILATGAKHKKLGVPRENELVGRGVSYCAVCDGAFFKEKAVAVCGGGNTALQDALYLAEECSKVYLIHRRSSFRGDSKLLKKLEALENVEIVTPAVIKALDGENELTGIIVSAPDGQNERNISAEGLFVAVGQTPENETFKEIIELDDFGYALAGEDCLTNIPGLFVAGDCRSKNVRQLTTAVGDGASAAVAACEYIEMH